jgi:hypothetical protein
LRGSANDAARAFPETENLLRHIGCASP